MTEKRDKTLAMLNDAHTFPGPYMFKVIGPNSPQFAARALQILVVVLGRSAAPKMNTRASTGGRHQSVTLRAQVQSAEQVLDIYHHLADLPDLKMVL